MRSCSAGFSEPLSFKLVFGPVGGSGGATVFASGVSHTAVSDGTNDFPTAIAYCPRVAGCAGGKTPITGNEPSVIVVTQDATSLIWANRNSEIRRVAKP
jgi:hypothetical protein